MSENASLPGPAAVSPPSRHQLAGMIWLAVFPTLTVLNVALRGVVQDLPVVLRTLVLATIAVPVVMYGLMPLLLRVRARLLGRLAGRGRVPADRPA